MNSWESRHSAPTCRTRHASRCERRPPRVVAPGTASNKGEGMAATLAIPVGATLVIPGIVLVIIVVLVVLWLF
jgi:hypothetical protein